LESLARRFLQIMAEPIETSAGLLSVTGSLGFALFPAHGEGAETLRGSADAAMYEAKRSNAGWRLFDPGQMQKSALR
jgi:GGDEF domain-containing protein